MPNRKRNLPGYFTHTSQEFTQPLRSRGEDIYGESGDWYGEGNASRRFPLSYEDESRRNGQPRRGDWQRNESEHQEDFGNYGRGGYYGNTYRGDLQNLNRREHEYDRGWSGGSQWPESNQRTFGSSESRFNDPRFNEGSHRGKGPKGYQRSDERIRDDINDRLADDSWVDASEIEVTVISGEVTLSGTVDNRYMKRRTEDIAEDVGGVKNVENHLRVSSLSDHNGKDRDRTTNNSGDFGFEDRKREGRRKNAGQEVI